MFLLIWFLRRLCRVFYGFRAYNEGVLKNAGPILLLSNHVSWWDWILLGVCLDEDWRFVTSSVTARISWFHRRIMINRRTIPVDINSPFAVKHMAEYLQSGGRLVLFPEGRLSRTGSLMKLFEGTGFLISRTPAKIVTAYIRGAQRLPFSPNPNLKAWFPRVSVHFSNFQTPPSTGHASMSDTRHRLTDWVQDQMTRQRFETELEFGPPTLPQAIARAAKLRPGKTILQDATMRELNYRRLFMGAGILAKQWRKRLGSDARRVGVLLPNVNAMPVALLSLWAADKIPAVLNYSTGPGVLAACARLSGLKQILTSRAFIERSHLDLAPLRDAGIELLFLEDVRAGITSVEKMTAALRSLAGLPAFEKCAAPEETAVVLFTSGSEGDPKGVELTHRNILANIQQMLAVIDLVDSDRLFNALPLFHSFGLCIGLFLPLVTGAFTFLYVSPLHYHVIPSAFYNLNCTVFFATNTFLQGYARKAHPYDFHTLRYLFAGAEKLQESTSALWMRKFGIRVLEGYGATECSPCLSANVPMHPREGTAGRFLPGIEHRLEQVEGISGAEVENAGTAGAGPSTGRLFVRGPNIMKGYLNPDANARFKALEGWYDTGDIAHVDADGFVHILGRLRRFAKISGEMISLAAVEDLLSVAFPQYGSKFCVAVISQPDETKGEKLLAITNEPRLTLAEIRQAVQARGLSNLAAPREIRVLHELPRLGSGKVDHRRLAQLVMQSR